MSRDFRIESINVSPSFAISASPCVYESEPLHVSAHSFKKNKSIEFAKPCCDFLIKVQGRNIHCFATRLKTAVAVTNHEDMASSSLSAEGANKRPVKWATGGWPPSPILPRSEALLHR